MTARAPIRTAVRPAQARMVFARSADGQCYIEHQQVSYPYHLGRVLRRAEDPPEMATVLLQSCSGGIFEGENLGLECLVGEGAAVHVSTGASTIVHGMRARGACQRTRLEVRAGGLLEFLPKPTLLFPRASFENSVEVLLHPGATLLLWDACLAHGPGGDSSRFREYHSRTRITDPAGRLRMADNMRITGADLEGALAGVNDGLSTLGTFFILSDKVDAHTLLLAVREVIPIDADIYVGVSELPGRSGIWIRMLASSSVYLLRAFNNIWCAVRTIIMPVFFHQLE